MFPYYVLTGVVVALSCASELVRGHFTRERARVAAIHGLPMPKPHAWTPIDVLVMSVMIAFSASRYKVGTDYGMYIRQFEQINTSDWQEQIDASPQEFGYTILSLALRSVSESPFAIFWVMAVLTIVPIYIALKKKSANMPLSLALFIMLAFFVSPFNVVRQGAAIGLNFLASTYLDKNKKLFVFFNILASLFHASVLIVAALQWLAKSWKPTSRQVAALIAGTIVITFSFIQLPVVGTWLALLNPRYETYVGSESAGLGTYLLIAVYLSFIVFSALIAPLGGNTRYAAFALLGTAFLIVGTQSVVLSRMEMYMSIFLILLVPNQIEKQRKRAASILTVCLASAMFFAFYLANWADLTPYQTYYGVVR